MEGLTDLVETALEKARTIILDGKEVLRVFIAVDGAGNFNIIAAPKTSEQAEVALLNALRVIFIALEIQQFVVVSEAWMGKHKGKDLGDVVRPSEDPNRIEIIMAAGVSREKIHFVTQEIRRNPIGFGEPEWTYDGIDGRLTVLLPPSGVGPVPEEVKHAAMMILKKMGISINKETLH